MPLDSDVGGEQDPGLPGETSQVEGESNTGKSSGLFFSEYSKAAADEDKDIVERWQKDAEGILIFTGLFSAAVAALLAVTVQDLKSNSQDTSAFYLGNIYQVLADPNATRPSTPPPVATPPSFSAPRYAIWVNSLWFLSLVMSLSCALWATSIQQWARRYLHRAQPFRCNPENRARQRAFFFEGVEKMHIPWAVDGLPVLLHLSLFLFFGGVAIFLFNVDREVFSCVIWWIVLFTLVYGLITLLPILQHNSPYHSPLSTSAWFLYASIGHVTFKIANVITYLLWWIIWPSSDYRRQIYLDCEEKKDLYREWMLGGVEKAAEDTVSKRSSEIDFQILDWTIGALGDDDSLKAFFETIPRSFNSKTLEHLKTGLPFTLQIKIGDALFDFCRRTFSSSSISDSEKVRRFDIFCNAQRQIEFNYRFIPNIDKDMPQTLEMGYSLLRWLANDDQSVSASLQHNITGILVNVRERSDSWVMLAVRTFGLRERDIWSNIALGGDSVLLFILIHVTRLSTHSNHSDWEGFKAFLKLDIRNTHPSLQDDFCTLWNEIVQEAWRRPTYTPSVGLLKDMRHFYIALHQGTNASPTGFTASTSDDHYTLKLPWTYQRCNLASHRPHSTPIPFPTHPGYSFYSPYPPTDAWNAASRQQAEQVTELPLAYYPTTTNEIQAISRGHGMAPPIPFSTRPTGVPLVVAAPQDITSTDTIVAPSAEPGTGQILSAISTSRPISATLPRLRVRGLVNTRNICFANAVLQVLANSPPFWNLFRELADLKRQHGTGAPETGGGATPLVDATVRFFEEYVVEEQSQPDADGTSRALDSFEPTYLYDAMKEKSQLKPLLDGQQQDAEQFLSLYLDALDEEIPALPAFIGDHQFAHAPLEVEERDVSQSGQVEVGNQAFVTNLFKSPITHIFGGKFRLLAPTSDLNQSDPVPTEDWRSLHLDIQPDSVLTVEDALLRINQSQSMQESPSVLGDARQQILIEVLPPVLVLHLKRFQYDEAAGGVIKIDKPVQFSPELEIPSDIMVPNSQRPSKAPRYKLYGVLYHHGESADTGHYTANVLHTNGDDAIGENWLHIDDEVVTRIGPGLEFGEHGGLVADEQSAYLLFYCLTSPICSS